MDDRTIRGIATFLFGGGLTLIVAMLFESPEMGIACAQIIVATVLAVK